MIKGIGVDIVEIPRLAEALARTPRLAERCFTLGEREYCEQQAHRIQHYAGRFAAKEAIAKAAGRSLPWHGVEISHDQHHRPVVHLSVRARELMPDAAVLLSISHSGDYAVAFAILIEAGGGT